jgi:tRNA 2-thiouridine synthesizing protein A
MDWLDRWLNRRRSPTGDQVREVHIPGQGRLVLVRSVDCLGAMCPRPQLLTMKVMGEIRAGEVIEVLSDNPTAVEGFSSLALALNCTLLKTLAVQGHWRMYLRKG